MSTPTVKVDRNADPPTLPPASSFFYVDQGSYQTLTLSSEPLAIYSDSATSCIIAIVLATTADTTTATLAHLDSPECIKAFFQALITQGADSYRVIAQGANPPDNNTAKDIAAQLNSSVDELGEKLADKHLFLLEGDPRDANRGNFALVYDDGIATVTNQPYKLELYQRDPTCGGQTIYCIMRREEHPPVQLRDASLPFSYPQLVELASMALRYCKIPGDPASAFTNIINLQNDEILQGWSTTPEYEAPWFADQLKMGAAFALAMAPVVNLCEQHLTRNTPPTFLKMRKTLLEPIHQSALKTR